VLAVAAVVVLVVALGFALAASRGRPAKPKPTRTLPAAKQFGDDADLMRRLERPNHVRGSR
jgi:hypothetical protein